jgi:hypothetical protein
MLDGIFIESVCARVVLYPSFDLALFGSPTLWIIQSEVSFRISVGFLSNDIVKQESERRYTSFDGFEVL